MPYLLIAPLFALMLLFVFRPLFASFAISLSDWQLGRSQSHFIGLGNFEKLYADPQFWNSLGRTAIFATSVTIGSIVIGLACALATHRLGQRAQGFWHTLFFLPVASTLAAMSIVWKLIFHTNIGFLNALLKAIGLSPVAWLDHGATAMVAVTIVGIWSNFGFAMILFLAGLTAIPEDVHDAAKLDGAGGASRLIYVTIPLLAPITLFIVVILTIRSIETFDSILVLTDGGPLKRTQVLSHFVYEQAFSFLDAGYASAIAVTLFGILFALTSVQMMFFKERPGK